MWSELWQGLHASGYLTTVLTLVAVFFVISTIFSSSMRTYLLVGSVRAFSTAVEMAIKGAVKAAIILAGFALRGFKILLVFVYDSIRRIRMEIAREKDTFGKEE